MRFPLATKASGSTLVEVVVTVGILITTLLPLVAMLTMAMETSSKASNNTLGARIASQLTGEVQQADWQHLDDWDKRESYYDDQGLKLTHSTAAQDSVFTARIILPPAGMTMATTGALPANPWQRQMMVLVVSRPASQAKPLLDEAVAALESGQPPPRETRVSRSIIVNMQKAP